MTEENPVSMQDLHRSNVSPWSRWSENLTGEPASLIIATAPMARNRNRVWFAYFLAPLETCRMNGDLDSTQPRTIACSCSILLKLYAEIAYLPFMAFSNISRVVTRPMLLYETFSMPVPS